MPGVQLSPARRDRFLSQLADAQPADVTHGVIALLGIWTQLGGRLNYGHGSEASCFLLAALPEDATSDPWPFTIYPSGKCEVVFQHMLSRPPFDDTALRDDFRCRLNTIDGIELPAGKLEMRPGFPLSILASESRLVGILRALCAFTDSIWRHYGHGADYVEGLDDALASISRQPVS
jgi:hypothetical protein